MTFREGREDEDVGGPVDVGKLPLVHDPGELDDNAESPGLCLQLVSQCAGAHHHERDVSPGPGGPDRSGCGDDGAEVLLRGQPPHVQDARR